MFFVENKKGDNLVQHRPNSKLAAKANQWEQGNCQGSSEAFSNVSVQVLKEITPTHIQKLYNEHMPKSFTIMV